MVEEVEEGRPHTDTLRMFISHLFKVVGGQWRVSAVQAHERGADAIAVCLSRHAFGFVYIRHREGQPRIAGQPHALPGGFVRPTWFQVVAMQAVQPLQQLEEVVLVRVGEQLVS
ncbi:hypothetical protein D9M71_639130 [compost metagenome]